MAAGLTVQRDLLDAFAKAFDEEVARWAARSAGADVVETDGELSVQRDCARDRSRASRGRTVGAGIPGALFRRVFTIRNTRVVGERHLKMWVEVPKTGRSFDAIAFNYIEELSHFTPPEGAVQLVYRLDVNEYQGSAGCSCWSITYSPHGRRPLGFSPELAIASPDV